MIALLSGGTPAGVAWTVAAAALLAALPWWVARRATDRRVTHLESDRRPVVPGERAGDEPVDVPVLLELLGAALRSGAGVPRALEATGAAVGADRGASGSVGRGTADGAALRAAADALRLGADWDGAWRDAPGRLAPAHRALRGAWTDGASPSGALRAAGEELLRARRATARTAAARLAVRLVLPLGACFLPAFVLVGLVPVLLALGVDLLSG
ncbi:type II secretion system F family protein [Krasilnikoviella flava]|uniref:Type II secretion system (T2SS), protein F n=1 Tax=Krasilnikoviella flava TaxID=526729 RepID=A0A1T5LHD2_9MICO|nr:type II secretion system F family protein [Krasilnikoviella flava]SKC75165.1 Type II secretion system (T2SS), protein F [Krasilnikoviella flava]